MMFMKVSNQTAAQISELLKEITARYPVDAENPVMTDLSFLANPETGELSVMDDNDEEICSNTIDEWIDYQEENFYEKVREALRQCILDHKSAMESLSLLRPYSFILVDENHETIFEIYLVDDKTMIIESEELMKGLGKDLDNFINQLLKE
jgi:hypothetical protein